MSPLVAWLLGIGAVLFVAVRWYTERKQRRQISDFFNRTLDKQINERDAAIKDLTRKQGESLEEYYAKIAKYRADHKRDVANPNKGND